MQNFCIATAFTHKWEPLITPYCTKRLEILGQKLSIPTEIGTLVCDEDNVKPQWYKVRFLMELLNKYDSIWWVDADLIITRKLNRKILNRWFFSVDKLLVGSEDWHDLHRFYKQKYGGTLQTGSFFIRKSDLIFDLLNEVWSLRHTNRAPYFEQDAFIEIIYKRKPQKYLPNMLIKVYPQPYNILGFSWQPNCMVYHLAGNPIKAYRLFYDNLYKINQVPDAFMVTKNWGSFVGKYHLHSDKFDESFSLAENNKVCDTNLFDFWLYDSGFLHLYKNKEIQYVFDDSLKYCFNRIYKHNNKLNVTLTKNG